MLGIVRRASAAIFLCAAIAQTASATDVIISNAEISHGKLIVTGRTATADMPLTLDGKFSTTSDAARVFTFSVIYLPTDCIVSVGQTGSSANPAQAVVSDCGARGLNPLGAWSGAAHYNTDDVVTQLGSAWRARRDNIHKSPSASAADWEKFVSKGDPGANGAAGPQGPIGPTGATGPRGPKGDTGATGQQGPKGDTGAAGAPGAKGLTWQGAWSAANTYAVDDAVQFAGKAYVALQASTNADPKNPPSEPGYWSLLASGPNWLGAWDGAASYAINDAVSRNGSSYVAIAASNNQDPATASSFWSLLASKGDQGDKGDKGDTGAQGAKGDTGATGSQGPKGDTGAQGTQGIQGPKGDTGNTGAQGPAGTALSYGFFTTDDRSFDPAGALGPDWYAITSCCGMSATNYPTPQSGVKNWRIHVPGPGTYLITLEMDRVTGGNGTTSIPTIGVRQETACCSFPIGYPDVAKERSMLLSATGTGDRLAGTLLYTIDTTSFASYDPGYIYLSFTPEWSPDESSTFTVAGNIRLSVVQVK